MCVGQRLSADELPPTAAQTAAAVAQLPIAPEPLTAQSPPPASVPAHMLGPVPDVVIEIRVAASTGVERLRCRALPGCCNEVVPSHRHPPIVALIYSTRSGFALGGRRPTPESVVPRGRRPCSDGARTARRILSEQRTDNKHHPPASSLGTPMRQYSSVASGYKPPPTRTWPGGSVSQAGTAVGCYNLLLHRFVPPSAVGGSAC